MVARFHARDFQLAIGAEGSFFKAELDVGAQVGAPARLAARSSTAAGKGAEEVFENAIYPVLSNAVLSDMHYEAMKIVGPITYTADELKFAQEINDNNGVSNSEGVDRVLARYKPDEDITQVFESYREQPIIGDNFPALDIGNVGTGSTDVGDVSWITPISMMWAATSPIGATGHHWTNVVASGSTLGHKGMMHAAKVMALVSVELVECPDKLAQARAGFEKAVKGNPYQSLTPEHILPPEVTVP